MAILLEISKESRIKITNFDLPFLTFSKKFQFQMNSILWEMTMAFFLSNTAMISLCLYQMVNATSLPPLRLTRFIMEYVGVLLQYFVICNSSDTLDNCHGLLCRAVNTCHWETCTPRTRRDICLLLSRVQKSNHVTFFGAFVILRRFLFLRVLRLSFSFVNFMRLQGVKKFKI